MRNTLRLATAFVVTVVALVTAAAANPAFAGGISAPF